MKKFIITRYSYLADKFDGGFTAELVEQLLNHVEPESRAKWTVTEILPLSKCCNAEILFSKTGGVYVTPLFYCSKCNDTALDRKRLEKD